MFRDVTVRAAKTFVQSFFAALLLPANVYDASAWEAALLAAAAAGISAAMNVVKDTYSRAWREPPLT